MDCNPLSQAYKAITLFLFPILFFSFSCTRQSGEMNRIYAGEVHCFPKGMLSLCFANAFPLANKLCLLIHYEEGRVEKSCINLDSQGAEEHQIDEPGGINLYVFPGHKNKSELQPPDVKNLVGIKVMTCNIRLDTPVDSFNNWKYRKIYLATMIRFYEPDILGTQEVLDNQLHDLLTLLPEYDYIGVGRKDGKSEGEYSAIFYRKNRFKLVKFGNFWLSQTPEIPGSRGWDAACERIVTWGVLLDEYSRKQIAVFNTHFDHIGKSARLNSAMLLKERISQIKGSMPVILTGDFNDTEFSETIQTLQKEGKLVDTRKLAGIVYGPEWTFHGFGKVPLQDRERIDFIFVSPEIRVKKYASVSELCDTIYLSDHNPVLAEIIPE